MTATGGTGAVHDGEPEDGAARRMGETYRAMFEDSPQPMYVLDRTTLQFLAANDAAVRQYGYTREELLGMTAAALWPLEDAERNRERATRPLPLVNVLMRHRKKDGSICRVEVCVNALTFDGRASRLVLVNDVTARLAAEEALSEARASEATFRSFVEAAPDAIVIANRQGTIVLVNTQTERLYGYTRDELIGQPTEMVLAERFRAAFPARLAGYFAKPGVRTVGASGLEVYGRRKDGTEFPIEFTVGLIETVGARSSAGSSATRPNEERPRSNGSAWPPWWRFRTTRSSARRSRASSRAGTEGRSAFSATPRRRWSGSSHGSIPADHPDEESEILEHLASGHVERFETVRLRKDGHEIHVSVTSSPVRDSSGDADRRVEGRRATSPRGDAPRWPSRARRTPPRRRTGSSRRSATRSRTTSGRRCAGSTGSRAAARGLRRPLDAEGQDYLAARSCGGASKMGRSSTRCSRWRALTPERAAREPVDLSAARARGDEQLARSASRRAPSSASSRTAWSPSRRAARASAPREPARQRVEVHAQGGRTRASSSGPPGGRRARLLRARQRRRASTWPTPASCSRRSSACTRRRVPRDGHRARDRAAHRPPPRGPRLGRGRRRRGRDLLLHGCAPPSGAP